MARVLQSWKSVVAASHQPASQLQTGISVLPVTWHKPALASWHLGSAHALRTPKIRHPEPSYLSRHSSGDAPVSSRVQSALEVQELQARLPLQGCQGARNIGAAAGHQRGCALPIGLQAMGFGV